MSAHTPGPWIIEAENPNDIISDVYDVEICNIQPVDTGGPKNWHHGEQTKANATLIASAPELLALCVQSRAVMSTMLEEEFNVQECIRNISKENVLRAKIAALSLAIARATGGEV